MTGWSSPQWPWWRSSRDRKSEKKNTALLPAYIRRESGHFLAQRSLPPGLQEPVRQDGGYLRALGQGPAADAQVDAQGDDAADEEEAVEADASGHHDGGGHQAGAEEEGEGVEGHPLGGAHGAGQGEGAYGQRDQGLGAHHLEKGGAAEAEAQVHGAGYGVEGGELEEGEQEEGGHQAEVGPEAGSPLPVGGHLPLQTSPDPVLMLDQAHPDAQANQAAGEAPGGIGEEHHGEHAGGEEDHHHAAIEEEQAQPSSQRGPDLGEEEEGGGGVEEGDGLIAHGDEHHVEGAVGSGDAVLGHVEDLGGLSSGGGGGDGAHIEAGEGVAQTFPIGHGMTQPAQNELGAQGFTAHEAEHESQSQDHIPRPDRPEHLSQSGDGLLPQEKVEGAADKGGQKGEAEDALAIHQRASFLTPTVRAAISRSRLWASS